MRALAAVALVAAACRSGTSAPDLAAVAGDLAGGGAVVDLAGGDSTQPDLAPPPDLAAPDLEPAAMLTGAAAFNFGAQVVGFPVAHTFTFTNGGSAATPALTVNVSGGAAYVLGAGGTNLCNTTLGAGQSCTVDVVFSAQSMGAAPAGAVTVSGGGLSASTTLSGAGATTTFDSTTTLVNLAGAGGAVSTSPAGPSCGAGCVRFPSGTAVTITATPSGPSLIGQWAQACASTVGASCGLVLSQDRAATVSFRPATNFMFVTSVGIEPGTLGPDLNVADTHCGTRASAGLLGGSHYKAWLASSSVNAATHIGGSGGWIRVDGRPFASSSANLAAGKIFYPPRINELGADVGPSLAVHTNANGDGSLLFSGNYTCSDYMDTNGVGVITGLAGAGTTSWTYNVLSAGSCNTKKPIYCFETDFGDTPVPPSPPPGSRYIFATTMTWHGDAGMSAFQTECTAEAAGKLPGAYQPLVSTSSAEATTGLTLSGSDNWYRPDNVQLTATPGDLATGSAMAGPHVTAAVGYQWPSTVWTGAPAPSAKPTTGAPACVDWASTMLTTDKGNTGTAVLSGGWFNNNAYLCNFTFGVLCVQQ